MINENQAEVNSHSENHYEDLSEIRLKKTKYKCRKVMICMNGKACSSDDFECMKGCLLLYGTESNWMIPFQDSNSELLCFINTEQGEVLLTLYSKIFSQNSILNLFPY